MKTQLAAGSPAVLFLVSALAANRTLRKATGGTLTGQGRGHK